MLTWKYPIPLIAFEIALQLRASWRRLVIIAGPGVLVLREEPGICLEEKRQGQWGRLELWKLLHALVPIKLPLYDLFFAPCSPPRSRLPTARRRAVMALKLATESLCRQG